MALDIDHVEYRRIGAVLWQTQRALSLAMERYLRTEKVGLSQALALMALRDEPGLSGAALGRRLLITAQSAGTLLAQLDTAGWVERRPHAVHRAIVETYLSSAGSAKLDRVIEIFDAFDARLEQQLGEQERTQLFGALRTCLGAAVEILREAE